MKFYTSVEQKFNDALVIGYENGKRFQYKEKVKPRLYVASTLENATYHDVYGVPVEPIDFDSINDAKDFINKYKDVHGFNIYGMTNWIYPYMNNKFPGQLEVDPKLISTVYLDIENKYDDTGFPKPELAAHEITAITLRKNDKVLTFGCGDYIPSRKEITYIKCKDEVNLLYKFLDVWNSDEWKPDCVVGYNCDAYDIPYLYNRICNVIGDHAANRLSPWGIVKEYTVKTKFGFTYQAKQLYGIAILDYLELYKKFSYTPQESYTLDHIAKYELNETKVDYSEYGSLMDLYEKNFQLYVDYNVQDVDVLYKLNEKMQFVELVYSIAYDAKINFDDAMTTVKLWDVIIHNYLIEKNIVVNFMHHIKNNKKIEGAFVKEPIKGMYNWVISVDLASLYPKLIEQYNISPETFFGTIPDLTVENILNGSLNEYKDQMLEYNATMAATGCIFKKDVRGFLPELMSEKFSMRSKVKKKMLSVEQELELMKKDNASTELQWEKEKQISSLNSRQIAIKIIMNGLYGGLANDGSRWFSVNLAESITKSGQLSNKWVSRDINKALNKILKTEKIDFVICSDTDSAFLCLELLVNKFYPNHTTTETIKWLKAFSAKVIVPEIEKSFNALAEYVNAYGNYMSMKVEKIADKMIITGKKRYIINVYNNEGVQYDKPKLKLTGIEVVRSSTPKSCKKTIKECIDIIFYKDLPTLKKHVNDFREAYNSMPYEDIAFPRGITDLDKYSHEENIFDTGTPIHVRGSLIYNDYVKRNKLDKKLRLIKNGDKIKFCYLKLPNPLGSNVIAVPGELPKELDIADYIDYNLQYEKSFYEPMKKILDAIKWSIEERATLERFYA